MIYTEGMQGWFDFAEFYDRIAMQLPNPCVIAEIGVWRGCSILHMACRLKEFSKTATIYAVDTFRGSPAEAVHADIIKGMDCTVLEDFLRNADKLAVRHLVIPVASDSIVAASLFSDRSFDFIFFDSTHTYDHLCAEIKAWRPKLKSGSTYGGHDIGWTDLERAVKDSAPNWKRHGPCWYTTA